MPLFRWHCRTCGLIDRRILPSRPVLPPCSICGNDLIFVSNTQTLVKETLDNGIMPRKLERLRDAEDLTRDHSTEKPEDGIV